MIENHHEVRVTQERIARFQRRLADLRHTARPEELDPVSSGYRWEIERIRLQGLEYWPTR